MLPFNLHKLKRLCYRKAKCSKLHLFKKIPLTRMTANDTAQRDFDTISRENMVTVRQFFEGQSLFITGGTGFIGKVLIEKILRSCPGVKRLYVTVRPKKDVPIEKRWEEISKIPLFDKVKEMYPDAMSKVKLINANLKHENLGISKEDREELINNVNIIFHVAATVQFADNIIDAFEQNTRAVYYLAELAKEMKNLKVLVYVSTCYTNFFRPEENWDEKLYPPVQDWRVVLKLLEREPLHLANLKEKLLCGHPNPYTFSKSLAEQIIHDYRNDFKAVIVRPSVVMSAVEEPVKGWVDSLNGMAVLCVINGLGILRVARHSDEAHQDYVPVDLVASFLCIAAREGALSQSEENPLLYNCTIGDLMTIRTSDISRATAKSKYIEKMPSKYIVWTRNLKLIENPYLYEILFFFEQIIPACILDLGIYLYGRKPLFMKIAKKLAFANHVLFKDFLLSKVHFKNDKALALMRSLKGEDKENFCLDLFEKVASIRLEDILEDTYLGVLRYFFKEDLSEKNIIRNKKRYNRIVMLEKTLKVMFYAILGYLAYHLVQSDKVAEILTNIGNTVCLKSS